MKDIRNYRGYLTAEAYAYIKQTNLFSKFNSEYNVSWTITAEKYPIRKDIKADLSKHILFTTSDNWFVKRWR